MGWPTWKTDVELTEEWSSWAAPKCCPVLKWLLEQEGATAGVSHLCTSLDNTSRDFGIWTKCCWCHQIPRTPLGLASTAPSYHIHSLVGALNTTSATCSEVSKASLWISAQPNLQGHSCPETRTLIMWSISLIMVSSDS